MGRLRVPWSAPRRADKLEECRKVIAEAQSGKFVMVTSTLTLAEVLWLKGKAPIPEADREKAASSSVTTGSCCASDSLGSAACA